MKNQMDYLARGCATPAHQDARTVCQILLLASIVGISACAPVSSAYREAPPKQVMPVGDELSRNGAEQAVTTVTRNGIQYWVHHGRYENTEFKYGIAIPDGMDALSNLPSMPQQGFVIYLRSDADDCLYVSAHYNGLLFRSTADALNNQDRDIKARSDSFAESQRARTKLDKLNALRNTIRYRLHDSGSDVVSDSVIAMVPDGDATIIYEIGLITREGYYVQDKNLFERFIAGWQQLPTPQELLGTGERKSEGDE